MINGSLKQFLDTGWYSEAELFYNGYLYWCEGWWNEETSDYSFQVRRWKVEITDETCYRSYRTKDDNLVDYKIVYDVRDKDMEKIKRNFLYANIFEGKAFREVQKEIVWMDDEDFRHPIYEQD
ncbi:MAG: hypothetical protein II969_10740 [Anaerolineaceae bacterium]|nr:hypothetical protein [Anaerolineaceae bacterium]